jgi:hypothetical protein
MGVKTFTSIVQAKMFIEPLIRIAVDNACNRLLGKLQELIMSEYYDVFDSIKYDRTYQFYRSAMTKMLSDTVGMIFMNPDEMNYPFNNWGWAWTGEQQLEAANQGVHGGWSTDESLKHHYWDEFEKYCSDNAILILREELAKVGIKTVK